MAPTRGMSRRIRTVEVDQGGNRALKRKLTQQFHLGVLDCEGCPFTSTSWDETPPRHVTPGLPGSESLVLRSYGTIETAGSLCSTWWCAHRCASIPYTAQNATGCQVCNALEKGILDHMETKRWAIRFTLDAVLTVLKATTCSGAPANTCALVFFVGNGGG